MKEKRNGEGDEGGRPTGIEMAISRWSEPSGGRVDQEQLREMEAGAREMSGDGIEPEEEKPVKV